MDVQIQENGCALPQVIIQCRKVTNEILQLKRHIERLDTKLQAKNGGETCFVHLADVLYFESVDNRTFLYTEQAVMEIRQRLYALEDWLPEKDFMRSSKSQILNLAKIRSLKPEINRTILVTMCNGERLSISRKYVPGIKQRLSI